MATYNTSGHGYNLPVYGGVNETIDVKSDLFLELNVGGAASPNITVNLDGAFWLGGFTQAPLSHLRGCLETAMGDLNPDNSMESERSPIPGAFDVDPRDPRRASPGRFALPK